MAQLFVVEINKQNCWRFNRREICSNRRINVWHKQWIFIERIKQLIILKFVKNNNNIEVAKVMGNKSDWKMQKKFFYSKIDSLSLLHRCCWVFSVQLVVRPLKLLTSNRAIEQSINQRRPFCCQFGVILCVGVCVYDVKKIFQRIFRPEKILSIEIFKSFFLWTSHSALD